MKEKKRMNPRKVSAMKDFACVLPVLIFLAVFTYYPIAELFRISFTDWNMLNDTWHYVGFKTGSGCLVAPVPNISGTP